MEKIYKMEDRKKVILIDDDEEVILCTKKQNAVNIKCKGGNLTIKEIDSNKEKPNFVIKKLDYLELLRYIKFMDYYENMQSLDIDDDTNKILEKLYEKHFNMLVNDDLFDRALDEEFYIGLKIY